jgi:PIN domain nuclease of toxin-antitoxin system
MSALAVLDASAVIAFLQDEPGANVVALALQADDCVVTAANHAEIIAKAIDRGADFESITSILADLDYRVVDITAADGVSAGRMRPLTRSIGLSLGDRLCIATAKRLGAKILTADRPWLTVTASLELDIRCIRPDPH